MSNKIKAGFTLIELLVVIAIIGLLSSVILASLNSARAKGRDAKRVADIHQIQLALELYYDNNNKYPDSTVGNTGWWRSQCAAWGPYAADQVIPGLVPMYMSSIPADPSMSVSANQNCYLYESNGTDYALLDLNLTETDFNKFRSLNDPARSTSAYQGNSDPTACSLTGNVALKIYSPGARCW
jgi:prepilin-type N-terminal cleavage/methylation domain-containing protein